MKPWQMRALVFALAVLISSPLFAAIDGTIINGTSGQPQPNALVSLMQPGKGGMQVLGTTKSDAQGRFHFDQETQGPRILQVIYSGVTYNQVAPPGMPAAGLTVNVYEPTRNPGTAQLAQHLVLLQPGETELNVSENFIYQNSSKLSFHDPLNGSAQVFVPEAGRRNVKVAITAPGGMPISRDLGPTRTAGVFKIDYPLKPGETRFEVTYTMPVSKPLIFAGKVVGETQPVRLVVPNGVSLQGSNLQPLGQEPTTQASIYSVAGDKYQVEITGAEVPAPAAAAQGDDGRPQIRVARPRIYDQMWVILALVLFVLALGAVILFRREAPAPGKK